MQSYQLNIKPTLRRADYTVQVGACSHRHHHPPHHHHYPHHPHRPYHVHLHHPVIIILILFLLLILLPPSSSLWSSSLLAQELRTLQQAVPAGWSWTRRSLNPCCTVLLIALHSSGSQTSIPESSTCFTNPRSKAANASKHWHEAGDAYLGSLLSRRLRHISSSSPNALL